jgi:hypothetical protein
MKKTTTLLTGFLLLTIVLHAQNKQSKFLTEIAIGPSFPIGKFSSTDYKNDGEIPGFAKTGMGTQLSFGYYLNKSVGVMLLAGYTTFARNKEAYKNNLEKEIPGMKVNNLELKSWQTVKLMAGGFWITPLTSENELVLRTKLNAGVAKTAIPESAWSGSGPGAGTSDGHGDKISLPWAFCYQVSVALEYKLNSNLYVLLDLSSFNTTAKHNGSFTDPGSGTTYTFKSKYKMPTVNALLGVGCSF